MQQYNNGATSPNNWSHTFNLEGINAVGEGGYRAAPTGFYTGTIVSTVKVSDTKGRDAVDFTVEISEGEFKGLKCEKRIILPSAQTKNEFVWKGLFLSLGYPEQQLSNGFVPQPSQWLNVPVTFKWVKGNKETGTNRDLLFMSKSAWEYKKSVEEKNTAPQQVQTQQVQAQPQIASHQIPTAPQAQVIPPATPSNGSGFGSMNTAGLMNSLNNQFSG